MLGIYTESLSQIFPCRCNQILHLTDNKGVVSVFTIGSPKPDLQAVATRVYKVANSLGLKLYFQWKSREDPTMVLVDKGSRSPWLNCDEFSLDAQSISEVLSRGINLDGFASYHNKVVQRYYSLGFQIEAEGTDFLLKNSVPPMLF